MHKNIFRRAFNRLLHLIARYSPGAESIRPFLHKLRGVKIQGRTFIGDEVYLENEYPEAVEIRDEALIALRVTITAHFRGVGKIILGEKSWIGPGCMILTSYPGQTLTIGEGSALAAGAVVTKDVPPYTFVGGVPAKPIAKITVPMGLDTSYEEFKDGLKPLDKE